MTLCNNNDQTWFSDTQTSARPLGVVKTPGFQHHPRRPADVQAKKNMFDPYSQFKRINTLYVYKLNT